MDLPTCPSCGQSVLDDEPVLCPFCGAAMDGSSGPTKEPQRPAAPKKPASEKRAPSKSSASKKSRAEGSSATDDPFDIAAAPPPRRAIPCSPRRTASRPHRVRCPMCDTAGYVPASALGRPVRCVNRDCMVPVFTAPKPADSGPRGRSGASVSEPDESQKPSGSSRGSLVLYGIAAAVLLASAFGLKLWLDREPDLRHLQTPIEIVPVDAPDDDPTESADTASTGDSQNAPEKSTDIIRRLAGQIVQAARMSANRSKALCRRNSAEAFLLAGDIERAEKELRQLLVVSRQRQETNDYYRIVPRARLYWRAVREHDDALADSLIESMQQDADTIRRTGLLSVEAAIHWAAVLVHRHRSQDALAVMERVQVDLSEPQQHDFRVEAVWLTLARSAAEHGHRSETPFALIPLERPVMVAVGEQLALESQWSALAEWMAACPDEPTRLEILGRAVRRALSASPAAPVPAPLRSFADDAGPHGSRLLDAVASQTDDGLSTRTAAWLSSELSEQRAVPVPDISELLDYTVPDRKTARRQALIAAELAVSAASRGHSESVADAILAMWRALQQQLPATRPVRDASRRLDDSRPAIEEDIRSWLGRSPSDSVDREFRRYRRGLDRLAETVEQRRLLLICLLSRIAASGGTAGLQLALSQDESLQDELTLDPLCQVTAAEAVLAGGGLSVLADVTEVRVPRGSRIRNQKEMDLAGAWLDLAERAAGSWDRTLFEEFCQHTVLPGLRVCLTHRIVEFLAVQGKTDVLYAVNRMDDDVNRENALFAAGLWLTRSGQRDAVEQWIRTARLSATATAQLLIGIALGLPPDPAEDVDSPAESDTQAFRDDASGTVRN